MISATPYESSSTAETNRVWPLIDAWTRSSSLLETIVRVSPATEVGLPSSSVSLRNSVRLVLAEPPSNMGCVGMGDHRGAPFSITLNSSIP